MTLKAVSWTGDDEENIPMHNYPFQVRHGHLLSFSADSSNFSVLPNNIFSYLVNTWMPCLCTITNDKKTSFFNQFSVTSRRIRRTPPHKNFSFLLHKEARELKCNNPSSIEFILTHVETTFWVGMWSVIPLFSRWRICHVKCEWKSSISCKDMFLP